MEGPMAAATAFGALIAIVLVFGVLVWSPWESDTDGEGGGFGGDDGNQQEEEFVPQFRPGSTVVPAPQATPNQPLPPTGP